MGEAYFYHLTRSPMDATLPMLLDRALKAGWRVAVRGTSDERMDWLDEKLWLDEGFLPHGLSGGAFDVDQPVLLTTSAGAANGATCLMAVDGAGVTVGEVTEMARTCILFDGNDTTAVEAARDQWRTLTGEGCAAQYWSQSEGRWEKKAESGGA